MTHPSGAAWATRLSTQASTLARGRVTDGQVDFGGGTLILAAISPSSMVVHLDLEQGYLQPGHVHPDHDSLGFVVSGRIRMVVDGVEATLEPGDAWHHPRGSFHITEALEASTALEIHVPLRPDLLQRFGVTAPPSSTTERAQ